MPFFCQIHLARGDGDGDGDGCTKSQDNFMAAARQTEAESFYRVETRKKLTPLPLIGCLYSPVIWRVAHR